MTDGCRVECLAPEAAAAHRPAWADLMRRCLEPSVFAAPAFALPAMQCLPRLRPRVLLAWQADRLIGLCLVAAGPPGWPTMAWTHPYATAAFPVLDAVAAGPAFAAMLRWSARRLRPGLLLQGLPADGPTARLLDTGGFAAATLDERRRAVLPGGKPATGLAGKALKEFRRQARRLAEQGAVSFGSSRAPEAVARDLDAYLALEATGWKGRLGSALTQSPRLTRFAQAVTAGLAAEGCCRIDHLDLDGRPLAIGVVLRAGPTAYYWKTAFDEAHGRASPGVHLTDALSRVQAEESGLVLTDSCAVQDHAMIDRLWPDRMTVRDVLVGSAGQAGVLGAYARAERFRRGARASVVDAAKRILHRGRRSVSQRQAGA